MSKEWLEFLGGLFVFLGALVPVIRGTWRALRKRMTPRGLLVITLLSGALVLIVVGLIGFSLDWHPFILVVLFSSAGLIQAIAFILPKDEMARFEVGFLAISLFLCGLIVSSQLQTAFASSKEQELALQKKIEAAIQRE